MAVYTNVSAEEATLFLRGYDLGTFRELVGVESGITNTTYLLYTTLGRFILTLYEERTQTHDIPFMLKLMEHSAQKGVPCPLPLRRKTGESLGTLGMRPATLVGFLNGTSVMDPSVAHCAEAGRALASFHLASADFKTQNPNPLSLTGWQSLYARLAPRLDEVEIGLATLLQDELAFLTTRWPDSLPCGAIHADYFPDNVLFDGDGHLSGVIDFEAACTDILTYDLAIAVNAWGFEKDGSLNIAKLRGLVGGYQEMRPLSAAELEALPLLARGAAVRFLLTRLRDYLHPPEGQMYKPLDPSVYLTRLQFHQLVNDVTAYGFAA